MIRRSTRRPDILGVLALAGFLLTVGSPSGLTQSTGTPTSAVGAPGDIYLALGDSVAAGVGASRPEEVGYGALVRGYLERQAGRRVELLNLAVPGETTTSLLTGGQFDQARGFIAAAGRQGRVVSPITITIGANDLIRAGGEGAAREQALRGVAANLRRLFAELRAVTGGQGGLAAADLVATTYYDPTRTDPTLAGTDGWWIARLNDVIIQETVQAGGRVADVVRRFREDDRELTRYPSDIHPTNAGHEAIAEEIWRVLRYDTTPPQVRLDRPAPGALTRPIPTVAAVATDRVGVTVVELVIDGAPAGVLPYLPDAAAYATVWDTRTVAPGPHSLAVRAADAAGNTTTAEVIVEVPADPAAALGGGTPTTDVGA